jgi:hypothetical protein
MTSDTDYLELIAARVMEALNEVLPAGARLGERDRLLWAEALVNNVRHNCRRPAELPEALTSGVRNLLAGLQDDVGATLRMPWPSVDGQPAGYFAVPCVEVVGHTLRIWFSADGGAIVGPQLEVSLQPS